MNMNHYKISKSKQLELLEGGIEIIKQQPAKRVKMKVWEPGTPRIILFHIVN